jgi:predicted regulator of amino acid metabolism with ACT domain
MIATFKYDYEYICLKLWKRIQTQFKKQKGRLNVVRKMVELGIRVGENGKLYVGEVEVNDTAIARAAGVDRRVIKSTTKQILKNPELRDIFTRIKPVGASLVDVAKILDYSVLVIRSDPHKPGVIASVTSVLAKHNLVVRQALADDPDLIPEPCLTLVVDGKIPTEAIDEIRSLPLVKSLTILK